MTLPGGNFLRNMGLPLRGRRAVLLLALLLAPVLAMVQSAALAHNAEHGFRDHDHRHAACPVYIYGEHLALSDGFDAPVLPPLPPLPYARILPLPVTHAPALPVIAAPARAPPPSV